ncbi:MAG: hypothetical protein OXF79_22125 [Chloroflexi bacterium]|nr:hypothetical protein [Chloroflexota bacterium]
MRDQFVADVNDFGKYGLLRRLCGITREGDDDEHDPDLKLGVAWYYRLGSVRTGGDNIKYLFGNQSKQYQRCDPALWDALKGLVHNDRRTVANVEKLDFLRAGCRYYREITPIWGTPNDKPNQRDARLAKADQWLDGAIERAQDADIVFLDPDHKITGDKSRISKSGPMYVHMDEIKAFWQRGHSLVIYHQTNNVSGMVRRAIDMVSEAVPDAAIDVLHFTKAGHCLVFIIMSQECHRGKIRERIDAMLKGAWGKHFKCLYRGPAAADDISQAAN